MNSFIQKYKLPLTASLIAIAITATMDFTGYINFSAFPLILISLSFWALGRFSPKEIGLSWGSLFHYRLALFYPLIVIGAAVLLSYFLQGFQLADLDIQKEINLLLIQLAVGPLMVLLTEEGFFRGILWAAFRKAGMSSTHCLFVTSLLFTLWHVSAVSAESSYGLPFAQIPVYLINASLLGLIWGLLRMMSASVIVAAVSHAIWNTFVYTLFAYGEKTGLLGIENTAIWGPEVGILGIFLNGSFFLWLWRKTKVYRNDLSNAHA